MSNENNGEPLEHPQTVMFESGEYYTKPITEQMVYRYYKSVAPQIVEELQGDKIMTVIRTDGEDIIKKHFVGPSKSTVKTPEEFDEFINTGRTIEVHRIFGNNEPFSVVDIDPRPGVPFEDTKELTEKLVNFITKENKSIIDNVQVYFSGHRGFHVYFNYIDTMNVKAMGRNLKENLEDFLIQLKDEKVMMSLPKNDDETRLDITIFHEGGSIRLPYSLHKETGLAAVPVDNIRTFEPEEAKINKFVKMAVHMIKDPVTEKPSIGVDFDGTLWQQEGEDPYNGKIDEKIAELVRKCKEAGYDITIFTARIVDAPEEMEFISEVLEDANVPFDDITSEKKPNIEHIIDDKAINPDEVGTYLNLRAAKLKTTGTPPPSVPKNQFPRVTKNYNRFRQFQPNLCKPGSFWLKKMRNGDQLVMCDLKSSGKTEVQSKMVKKKKSDKD